MCYPFTTGRSVKSRVGKVGSSKAFSSCRLVALPAVLPDSADIICCRICRKILLTLIFLPVRCPWSF